MQLYDDIEYPSGGLRGFLANYYPEMLLFFFIVGMGLGIAAYSTESETYAWAGFAMVLPAYLCIVIDQGVASRPSLVFMLHVPFGMNIMLGLIVFLNVSFFPWHAHALGASWTAAFLPTLR